MDTVVESNAKVRATTDENLGDEIGGGHWEKLGGAIERIGCSNTIWEIGEGCLSVLLDIVYLGEVICDHEDAPRATS